MDGNQFLVIELKEKQNGHESNACPIMAIVVKSWTLADLARSSYHRYDALKPYSKGLRTVSGQFLQTWRFPLKMHKS